MTDPTNYAELHEFAESMLNELDAIQHTIFDLLNGLELQRRKVANIVENLAELLDARPVPAVLEFEEVDG